MNNIKVSIDELTNNLTKQNLDEIAPNCKKGALTQVEINKIIEKVAIDVNGTNEQALTGIILIMLKGGASGGTPQTLTVEVKGGLKIAKKNVSAAYLSVTGNNYLRRLAEGLAIQIGIFAEAFGLNGDLAQRISTTLKAETGEMLTAKELAWCSSFSQNLPDLASRSSERLVKLLAEDYKKRFQGFTKPKLNNQKGKGQKFEQKFEQQ